MRNVRGERLPSGLVIALAVAVIVATGMVLARLGGSSLTNGEVIAILAYGVLLGGAGAVIVWEM